MDVLSLSASSRRTIRTSKKPAIPFESRKAVIDRIWSKHCWDFVVPLTLAILVGAAATIMILNILHGGFYNQTENSNDAKIAKHGKSLGVLIALIFSILHTIYKYVIIMQIIQNKTKNYFQSLWLIQMQQ